MKITNKYGLPKVLELLARRDTYSKGEAQFSVTELIAPPRIRALQRKHDKEIERDVTDLLWALLGKTLHKVLEDRASAGSIPEQRLFAVVDGVTVSGGIDLQIVNGHEVDIADWKFTSTWAIMSDKVEWEQQLNVYAFLAWKNGRIVRDLKIVAILRDWSRAEAERNPNYPQQPVAQINVPLWAPGKAEQFVKERIRKHAEAHYLHEMGDPLPECTDDEKWMSAPKWAIRRPDGKRAIRVLDTKEEAVEYYAKYVKANALIEERKAEPIRCKRNYCNVAQWCDYGRQFISSESNEGGSDE